MVSPSSFVCEVICTHSHSRIQPHWGNSVHHRAARAAEGTSVSPRGGGRRGDLWYWMKFGWGPGHGVSAAQPCPPSSLPTSWLGHHFTRSTCRLPSHPAAPRPQAREGSRLHAGWALSHQRVTTDEDVGPETLTALWWTCNMVTPQSHMELNPDLPHLLPFLPQHAAEGRGQGPGAGGGGASGGGSHDAFLASRPGLDLASVGIVGVLGPSSAA